jgi:ABC-type glutathione transport system ATPase component
MALVEIRGLVKSFHNRKSGDVQILRSIDLALDASKTICVVG